MTPTREERKDKIAALRREQILQAGLDIFSRKGFTAATTSEIARAAGVAEGTIYNYFPSKRDLFIGVIQNFILNIPLLELIDKLPQGDTDATFRDILQNRFALFETGIVSHIPVLMAEVQRDPELKSIWTKQVLQPFLSKIEKIYENLMASGKARRMDPAIMVRCVGGMLLGFLMLKIMEGDNSPLNRTPQDQIVESVTDLLFYGLSNPDADEKE